MGGHGSQLGYSYNLVGQRLDGEPSGKDMIFVCKIFPKGRILPDV
jgi:hypothetical protein